MRLAGDSAVVRGTLVLVVVALGALQGIAASSGSPTVRAPGQDDAKREKSAIRAFQRAFRESEGDRDQLAIRRAALRQLEGFDSPAVAEALLDAWDELEKEALPIEKRRRSAIDKSKGGAVLEWRRALDPLRDVQQLLRQALEKLRQPDSVQWLVEHVLVEKNRPLTLRLVVARSAESLGVEGVPGLAAALDKARDASNKIVLMETLARIGLEARAAGDAVVKWLGDEDATVREKSAAAIARLGLPQGVEPLIAQLAQERGRTQKRMAIALEVLTGKNLGQSVDAWQRWLEAEGAPYTSGGVPLGQGESKIEDSSGKGYFHGIPQDGQSIVYVIDVSGSMVVSMANPEEGPDGRRPVPAAPGDPSRMDASKKELLAALGSLPDGTMFNIVAYATDTERFQPRMVEASESSIRRAQKWVEGLEPFGATNIYDAMESAFSLAGRGTTDRHYEAQVDTVFLLTDGRPMLPNPRGDWDNTDRIIEGVRRWNPYGRIVVHCVGLGKNINDEFLRQLASENGGVFVQR